ncbi:hypothetical protein QTP70_000820 [Hemibagrus guttatus]|uniref:Reverse transcriptase domain-containing protein n=1 Tax=Hemibagrus guttatus TaxID=175788 RepID=A0AAE0R3Y7_9TELE|nr:hypothetical protein QTP70_000820 [Hemibagrus guttatus]KAK3568304.1 hypothetical protein QTP86_003535 [Hemibagrus guttatus]
MHSSNHIIKFADDTTVLGLISKNDESAYREEVQRLTAWCKANSLSLNVDKTKEMVVGFRRAQSDHSPLTILHRRIPCGDRQEHQIPWCASRGEPHLVTQHHLHQQESPAAPLLPAEVEESPSTSPHPDHALQRDHRERPEQLHHCLVWELHRLGSCSR